uniref:Phage tail protein (Tail_P2_I) n=1 Tax=Candidatus Kentrum sp. FM TaxID=2126340 RepID=A0A450VLM3_9GAMM|nr:MAG: hypothetical protein BECKFM1743A_GA0114220_1000333 [Candidatus Kentron sp. FM]VFJ43709.1 MAG: hypothetical protein BECKFM1743C_GA0114222_1000333 [Candidatus Kentron sp. FM]VFK05693.1 MAG: hypothetical protein BECKFM1743B_GA0114221_1000333 [Candidatus Kentron sp. FM]
MQEPDYQLPVWLKDGTEANRLVDAAKAWWDKAKGWAEFPLDNNDPLTCHPDILRAMAWDRDIEPFPDEPEESFRLRVKHAPANTRDAGSKAGFYRIFDRLGLKLIDQIERFDETDWDVIRLIFNSGVFGCENHELLQFIIRKYGRTCRRYELASQSEPVSVYVGFGGHTITRGIHDPGVVEPSMTTEFPPLYIGAGKASLLYSRHEIIVPL